MSLHLVLTSAASCFLVHCDTRAHRRMHLANLPTPFLCEKNGPRDHCMNSASSGFDSQGHDVTKFWLGVCLACESKDNMEALHLCDNCMRDVCIAVQNSTELKVSINGPPAQLDLHIEETGMMSRNSGFNVCQGFENESRSLSVRGSVVRSTLRSRAKMQIL